MYAIFKQLPPLETDPRIIKKCTVKVMNTTVKQPIYQANSLIKP